MKSLEERQQREYERQEIIRKAVEAADRIIMDGSDGTNVEADFLTAEVAKKFIEKALHPFDRNMLAEELRE